MYQNHTYRAALIQINIQNKIFLQNSQKPKSSHSLHLEDTGLKNVTPYFLTDLSHFSPAQAQTAERFSHLSEEETGLSRSAVLG